MGGTDSNQYDPSISKSVPPQTDRQTDTRTLGLFSIDAINTIDKIYIAKLSPSPCWLA